jgi:AcrR family transcriptional regulator
VSNTVLGVKERKRGAQAGPGRPVGNEDYRTAILDAAEEQFALSGYTGTSLREISERVGVNQALINYYFRSKLGLYEAVFLRRAVGISDERSTRLQALAAGSAPPTVEGIIAAFLAPTLEMRATPGGRMFLRLQARLHTEPPEISYPLRRHAYDASTRAYADALKTALPHLSWKTIYWRLTLVIGAYLYAFSDTHRLDEIAPGIESETESAELLDEIVGFATAGMVNGVRPQA